MLVRNVKKKNIDDYNFKDYCKNNIYQSIEEYINENVEELSNTVAVGNSFAEWCLYNIFELREDEVLEALSISGKYDNGIDAIFENNSDLNLIQFKYGNSHNLDAMARFKYDCERLLTSTPVTDRQIVKEKCADIRQQFQENKKITCFYVTNRTFTEQELNEIDELRKFSCKADINFCDINFMVEHVEQVTGRPPKEFRDKSFNIILGKNFEVDGTTVITIVSLKDFAKFVKAGGNHLFHSNIRNYLSKSKINQGIERTLKQDADKFWYYNNGVTIVCEDYVQSGLVITLTEPQIVNGCQTAKSVLNYFSDKTNKEIINKGVNGNLLLKIIRTKRSANIEGKKELRDNITRYTNSQNAVRGLDFYALDGFQRDLQRKFEEIGYYFEIQRGAYIALDKIKKSKLKGIKEYSYLTTDKFKNVMPAKEVIQAFAAGIMQCPNVAYGKADELTPLGSKWEEICNDKTRMMPLEHFLFPFLILKYIKTNMGYKHGASDFRKSSSLLFLTTYYRVIMSIIGMIDNKSYESPTEINVDIYRKIIGEKNLNKEIMNLTNRILDGYFSDSKIEDDYVADNISVFLKTLSKSKNEPWYILMKRIKKGISNEEKLITDIKKILMEIKEV